jgi:hypothetical protein
VSVPVTRHPQVRRLASAQHTSEEENVSPTPRLCLGFVRHKAASQWINAVVSDAATLIGWRYDHFWESTLHGYSFSQFVNRHQLGVAQPSFATCADPRCEDLGLLPPFRGFHVIRDPRDVIVSAYFSHRNSHWFPEGTDGAHHQQLLRALPPEEGLLAEIEFSGRYLDRVAAWDFSRSDTLELKYEDLTTSPYDVFLDVFRFMGILDEEAGSSLAAELHRLPVYVTNKAHRRHPKVVHFGFVQEGVPGDELLRLVYKHRFAKRSGGRARGQEDARNPFRKGVHGDWMNHFESQHRAAFGDRYGDLVERLGYESSPDWRASGSHEVSGSRAPKDAALTPR